MKQNKSCYKVDDKLKKNALSLAVHLHLYYPEMWPQIKQYLHNIGDYPYHLFVTMHENDKQLIKELKNFHPQIKIFIVENKGYDVGPFVYFLQQINLNQYDIIMKIHSKSNRSGKDTLLNRRYVSRKYWFSLLIEALIGSNELFQRNITAFQNDPKLGMIGSKYCTTSSYKNVSDVQTQVIDLMNKLQCHNYLPITFVAGTMFMVRSRILQKIKDNFTIDDFAVTDGRIKDGTLAHIMERVFGCLVKAKGYTINGFDRNIKFELYSMTVSIRRFIFQKKITKSNCLQIKIFKIPVYHRRII